MREKILSKWISDIETPGPLEIIFVRAIISPNFHVTDTGTK